MYLKRNLKPFLEGYLKQYPIVILTGPRQSGKRTITRKTCKNYHYVSLEEPDVLEYATQDPRGFLETYNEHVIFDEVQQAPQLFSYLQGEVDRNPTPGRFVLTGSHQFLLNQKISQTLAGRTARLTLLPLSLAELCQRAPQQLYHNGKLTQPSPPPNSLYYYLFTGLYPRIYEYDLNPQQFYRDYLDTYVTKDLQQLLHVGDLRSFQNFLRMLAGRCGQRVNLTSLGNDLGVAHTTIKRWLSVLEASYVITLLEPYYNNFNKRLVKSPKVYFLDTGLLCNLLRIKKIEDLQFHSQIGGIFETFVVSEVIKSFYHHDQKPPLYFWQELNTREIDLMIDEGQSRLLPFEIKSSQTLSTKLFDNLNYWLNIEENPQTEGYLVYGGKEWQKRKNLQTIPWYAMS